MNVAAANAAAGGQNVTPPSGVATIPGQGGDGQQQSQQQNQQTQGQGQQSAPPAADGVDPNMPTDPKILEWVATKIKEETKKSAEAARAEEKARQQREKEEAEEKQRREKMDAESRAKLEKDEAERKAKAAEDRANEATRNAQIATALVEKGIRVQPNAVAFLQMKVSEKAATMQNPDIQALTLETLNENPFIRIPDPPPPQAAAAGGQQANGQAAGGQQQATQNGQQQAAGSVSTEPNPQQGGVGVGGGGPVKTEEVDVTKMSPQEFRSWMAKAVGRAPSRH